MDRLGKSSEFGRLFCFGGAILWLLCAFPIQEGIAYPGTLDVRVAPGPEVLRGKARDLEQTLMAVVYSLGAKVGRRSPESADVTTQDDALLE